MKIKNWPKFQHFKDRRPPWIKLYRDILDDDEWFSLPPISAKALVTLWLLASEDETKQGVLPPFKKIAFRLRMSEKSLQSIVSDLSHWLIQDDINLISDCHQLGPSETELETRERDPKKDLETETQLCVLDEFEVFWNRYPKQIGKKAARKAWEQSKDRPVLVTILESVDRAARSAQWMKENGQFIPHPATWINQGRWEDRQQAKPLSVMERFLARHQEEA